MDGMVNFIIYRIHRFYQSKFPQNSKSSGKKPWFLGFFHGLSAISVGRAKPHGYA